MTRAAFSLFLLGLASAAAAGPDFTSEIRPILSENCFHCHGPDGKNRKADLRLDAHADILRVKDGVALVKPGDPEASDLYRRLVTHDPEEIMPPPKANRTVSPAQIELVRQWIQAGAAWGEHWSYAPLRKPDVPAGGSFVGGKNPIDAFVGERLAREGLAPAPEAPRATLLRRVSLDLTGLPPTPAEVEAFVKDPARDAYEKQVDRLLASPAFGERMAWDWLDAARYADTNGYQGDNERTMWPWRDWVVDAFNRNLPYDQFLTWQLAGDLLPGATPEQKLATAFLRNHPINGEGGRIAEENRIDYVMDMAETVGTVWLGLTFNCCRCHDHKYDPATQRDYYSLMAFFNRTSVDGGGGNAQTPPVLAVGGEDLEIQRAEVKAQQAEYDARVKEISGGQAAWEKLTLPEQAPANPWRVLTPGVFKADKQTLTVQEDLSVLAGGDNPANDTYHLEYPVPAGKLAALRLEAIRDPSMTHGGLGRSDSGNFVLTDLVVELRAAGATNRLQIASAKATYEQGGFPVGNSFDSDAKSGWAVWSGKPLNRDHEAVFRLKEAVAVAEGATLSVTLRHNSPHASHNLGRFRLSATDQPDAQLGGEGNKLQQALAKPETQRSGAEKKLVREAYLASDDTLVNIGQFRDQHLKNLKDAEQKVPKVMVMEDLPTYRKTFTLERGIYTKPKDEVHAASPGFLPPMGTVSATNRLALAKWMVSPEQPLTARVVVNRFWQQVFGIGLVKTVEDFGVQAEVPKHLALLNWLAADFRDGGWDTKALIRTLVTSRTYRQSSVFAPGAVSRDPENRLLARGPRHRMPAWMIRDQALAVSGLLSPHRGGPAVNAYQPEGVWEEASFGNKKYKQDAGESLHRRSLYTFWRRIIAPTLFFDNAARQVCQVQILWSAVKAGTPARHRFHWRLAPGPGPNGPPKAAWRRGTAFPPHSKNLECGGRAGTPAPWVGRLRPTGRRASGPSNLHRAGCPVA
jgi:mono/diheme cytochrome c family protein